MPRELAATLRDGADRFWLGAPEGPVFISHLVIIILEVVVVTRTTYGLVWGCSEVEFMIVGLCSELVLSE